MEWNDNKILNDTNKKIKYDWLTNLEKNGKTAIIKIEKIKFEPHGINGRDKT